jgi:hypothetical protein
MGRPGLKGSTFTKGPQKSHLLGLGFLIFYFLVEKYCPSPGLCQELRGWGGVDLYSLTLHFQPEQPKLPTTKSRTSDSVSIGHCHATVILQTKIFPAPYHSLYVNIKQSQFREMMHTDR